MLILVTWTWRTQTERVWQSSAVNTSTTSWCHQRHNHEPVVGDRERLPFSQNEYRAYYNSLLKNAWQKLIVITDSETHTYAAACSYHVDSCMVVYVYEKYAAIHTQQPQGIYPMLFQFWYTIFDAGLTLKQNRMNASCCWAGSSSPGARYRQSVPQGGNLPTVMTVGLPSCRKPHR